MKINLNLNHTSGCKRKKTRLQNFYTNRSNNGELQTRFWHQYLSEMNRSSTLDKMDDAKFIAALNMEVRDQNFLLN